MSNPLELLNRINGHICVIGSMNADYTVTTERLPKPGETVNGGQLTVLPGGKSGNQAAAAARIGAHVKLLGAVGTDSNAEFLIGKLKDAGVDTSKILRVPGPSGTTVIAVDAHGENTIIYSPGSNAQVTAEYVASQSREIEGAQAIGLCLESPISAVTQAARIGKQAGVKVLLNDSPFTTDLPSELIEHCDILLVNEHEMAQLLDVAEPEDGNWDGVDWTKIRDAMHDYGFEQAVITLGGDGSVVIDGDDVHRVQPVKVDALDTTGCGDAFMGTILAGLSSGLSLFDSASLASYVSAYAAMSQGAQASYGNTEDILAAFER